MTTLIFCAVCFMVGLGSCVMAVYQRGRRKGIEEAERIMKPLLDQMAKALESHHTGKLD